MTNDNNDQNNATLENTNAQHSQFSQNDELASKHPDQIIDENVIEWIKSRRSIANLQAPAPNQSQVEKAIQCAMSAPDHKKLKPWRFIVLEGDSREAFGKALLTAAEAQAIREETTLSEATITKTLKMPLRAPMIIAVVTRIQYHNKVPTYEQLLSAGSAVQNLILALKAQGFNTVWRTGLLANEPAVKSYFNVSGEDYIAAFVYTGTSPSQLPARDEIDTTGYVQYRK